MQPRLSYADFTEAAPGAHTGVTALARAAGQSAVEKSLADLSPRGASNKDCASLLDHFSESAAMFRSVAIAAFSSRNRLGFALRFALPPLRAPGE